MSFKTGTRIRINTIVLQRRILQVADDAFREGLPEVAKAIAQKSPVETGENAASIKSSVNDKKGSGGVVYSKSGYAGFVEIGTGGSSSGGRRNKSRRRGTTKAQPHFRPGVEETKDIIPNKMRNKL